jgi:hypothetical protein
MSAQNVSIAKKCLRQLQNMTCCHPTQCINGLKRFYGSVCVMQTYRVMLHLILKFSTEIALKVPHVMSVTKQNKHL